MNHLLVESDEAKRHLRDLIQKQRDYVDLVSQAKGGTVEDSISQREMLKSACSPGQRWSTYLQKHDGTRIEAEITFFEQNDDTTAKAVVSCAKDPFVRLAYEGVITKAGSYEPRGLANIGALWKVELSATKETRSRNQSSSLAYDHDKLKIYPNGKNGLILLAGTRTSVLKPLAILEEFEKDTMALREKLLATIRPGSQWEGVIEHVNKPSEKTNSHVRSCQLSDKSESSCHRFSLLRTHREMPSWKPDMSSWMPLVFMLGQLC